jgi:5-bromo-4-chloroindolyl phosphate hydrolysis protein
MFTMIKEEEKKVWTLSPKDRCDSCNAEALVQVKGVTGELLFCGHHYNKIMNDPTGYTKMMNFMYEVIDERDKLIEDKSKEEPHA